MDRNAKIFVAGHRGMVGSAVFRCLKAAGFANLVVATRAELDLREQAAVRQFFDRERPEHVILAAAKVGGIYANKTYPADFIYDNLQIEANVVHEAWTHGAKRLMFLGSSCIYPREAAQPMVEDVLMTGPLEPTNRAYAVAKIAGIELCAAYHAQYGADYRSLMPTNLYGPNDNYDARNSHVIAALIRKFHEAKAGGAASVELWGTGKPLREFLHADDLARATLFALELPKETFWGGASREGVMNVGSGEEIRIEELARLVARIVGYDGPVHTNPSYPDGPMRKVIDSSRLRRLGWRPEVPLEEGLRAAYADFMRAHPRGAG